MRTDRRFCSVCAWRGKCQRRFAESDLHCIDYTRDVTIKDFDKLMVDFQLERWREEHSRRKMTIAISRLTGSGGSEIARILANELRMDLVGGEIINKVAQSAKMSEKVVRSLDEKDISRLDSFIDSMFASRHLSPDSFLKHLTKVVLTIGEHGNTILLGRGAQYILPKDMVFRVRIVAPREIRVKRIMEQRQLSKGEAEKYIDERDRNRKGFVQKYFKANVDDPDNYDVIINTERLGIEGSVEAIKRSFLEHCEAGKPPVPRISESFAPATKKGAK
jgi:cytidylate kinase